MTESALQPIIVIGMHRSGTSLLARLLRDLGVQMGADCDEAHAESQSMLAMNESLLAAVGATWHQPHASEGLIDHEIQYPDLADNLRSACWSEGSRFTGEPEIGLFEQRRDWGWKDPRTTLTLPVWLSIFPRAKIIEVVRNGVDVAQSLVTRERSQIRNWLTALRKQTMGGRILQCLRTGARRLRRPVRKRVCPDLDTGFSIWSSYLDICGRALQNVRPVQRLSFRYEDLLGAPEEYLSRIGTFVGCSHEADLAGLATSICGERGAAFVRDHHLRDFYETVRHHPKMIEHDYADLI